MSNKLLAQATKSKMLSKAVTGASEAVSSDPRFRVSADHPEVVELDLERIDPNPHQPRRHFDETALQALAESIHRVGVRQPIGVRKGDGGRYTLVWGERRVRASRLAGRSTIYALLVKDGNGAELALIENLQREDLDAVETAAGLAALREQHGYTHEQLGAASGLGKTEVTRTLGILALPSPILEEYPAHRRSVGKSALFEMVDADNPALQRRMWEMAKGGATVATLRSARKDVAVGADAREGNNPAADRLSRTSPPAAGRMVKSAQRTFKAIDAVREQGASLDDDQRSILRQLRDRIDALLAE
ncbi:ParB/RepB/Spo0J family partition protein [Azospirillum sp. YIM DDC1]|uniref:ParB/RepB/Spo0J family partition protein n=1 Tax=Azospirillum aestuarii TaxID=2802052 RepID=A0ABS1I4P2_9PROT|nr:ParB/RepB/Spo0J family partition protein [Azospirillum aestuarii]MBK4722011.1 ParB/RepB/Spo0J family partition protein [Azospirillum aestuarii]